MKNINSFAEFIFTNMSMISSEQELLKRVVKKLVDDYGYSWNQISFEVQIFDKFTADCIIYADERKNIPFIVIEVKISLNYPFGFDQLANYMRSSGAKYGMLTNSVEKFCFRLIGKEIIEIFDIPRKGEEEFRIISKNELKPVTRLDYKLQKISDYILRKDNLSPENTLEELQKLILCKIEDEKSFNEIPLFWISTKEAEKMDKKVVQKTIKDRINNLFYKVKEHHPQIYTINDNLNLSTNTLYYCITQLQYYSLSKAPYDVITTAYSKFISKSMYGYLSQYFTPKNLVDFIVELLNPSENEKVLDPACGSGGFLISIMNYVWNNVRRTTTLHYQSEVAEYARKRIYGFDINPKMVSICKTNMLIQGNGHTNIFIADFLSDLSALNIQPESFDIVVTDPPLSRSISNQKILHNFELGMGKRSQKIEVLFLEKCVDMIKPNGRMAMVVPGSLLTSPSLSYARNFLLEKTLIRAIISLPARTFIPYSKIKTSIILIQKKERARKYEDYDVFMAEASDAADKTLNEIVKKYRKKDV